MYRTSFLTRIHRAEAALCGWMMVTALVIHVADARPTWPSDAPGSPPSAGAAVIDVINEIDARFRAGAIDEATRQRWRVSAIRDPSQLPLDLRVLPQSRARGQATRILFEAFQWLARQEQQDGAQNEGLKRLFMPKPPLSYNLDSTRLPIRVTYGQANDEPYAKQVLAAAEHSWDVESGEYGFLQPPIDPSAQRYYFFIEEIPAGGAYAAPYNYNPETPWADCFTYIVIDRPSTPEDPSLGIAHEVNHSMQAAMDCDEVFTFWESTAAYIMTQVYPDGGDNTALLLPFFQEKPWQALDYFQDMDQDIWYVYGGVLLPIYLTDTYADPYGPQLLAQIWTAAMQLDGAANEPDFFTAIGQTIAQWGGPADFARLFVDFSEARFFVGQQDDGAHMAQAAQLQGAELTVTAHYSESDLPLKDRAAPTSTAPQPYGANHLQIDLPATAAKVRVGFSGQEGTRWAARAVLYGGAQTVAQDLALDAQTRSGNLTIEIAGHRSLLLVVANLGSADFKPGGQSWPATGYTFSVEPEGVGVAPGSPRVTAVLPAEVQQGATAVSLRIMGQGFVAGDGLRVAFGDQGLVVKSLDRRTPTELQVTIDVGAAVSAGPTDILVTNPDGTQARGLQLLNVVAATPYSSLAEAEVRSSIGCSVLSTHAEMAPVILLAVFIWLWPRREHRTPRGR